MVRNLTAHAHRYGTGAPRYASGVDVRRIVGRRTSGPVTVRTAHPLHLRGALEDRCGVIGNLRGPDHPLVIRTQQSLSTARRAGREWSRTVLPPHVRTSAAPRIRTPSTHRHGPRDGPGLGSWCHGCRPARALCRSRHTVGHPAGHRVPVVGYVAPTRHVVGIARSNSVRRQAAAESCLQLFAVRGQNARIAALPTGAAATGAAVVIIGPAGGRRAKTDRVVRIFIGMMG